MAARNMSFAVGGGSCVRMAIRRAFELSRWTATTSTRRLSDSAKNTRSVALTLFQVIERLGAGDEPLQSDTLKALIATFKAVLHDDTCSGQERRETMASFPDPAGARRRQDASATARTASTAINLEQLFVLVQQPVLRTTDQGRMPMPDVCSMTDLRKSAFSEPSQVRQWRDYLVNGVKRRR